MPQNSITTEGENEMMIKIEAYIREEKFEDVKKALDDLNVNGLTVYQVMGCGIQRGYQIGRAHV